MKRILIIGIALFFLMPVLTAQDTSKWYLNKPVKEIRFIGLAVIKAAELDGKLAQYLDKSFSEVYSKIQNTLYGLDYFASIQAKVLEYDASQSGVILEFTVKEKPVIYKIELKGNTKVKNRDILDQVIIKEGDMLSRPAIQDDAESIRKYLVEKGFVEAIVTGSIEESEKGSTVVFTITEGPQVLVKTLIFSGNKEFSSNKLTSVVKSKTQSFFSKGLYTESNLTLDIKAIETLYQEKGFIDVKVLDIKKESALDTNDSGKKFMTLTYYIEEGAQYKFGGIEFEGNELFTSDELRKPFDLKKGEPLNLIKFRDGYSAMMSLYMDDGYYNNFVPQEIRNEEEGSISYKVVIQERDRAHVEAIIIEGNKKTKDHVIRREILLQEGDVFSRAALIQSYYNIMNLDLFETVVPDVKQGSASDLVKLVFTVEEKKVGNIYLGISQSGDATFPISGSVSWKDNNFLGEGLLFDVKAAASPALQSLSASFIEKYFLGMPITAGLDFSIENASNKKVLQDFLNPIFGDDDTNAVPDPFDGHYVYPDTGLPYIGTPSAATIESEGLLTDYEYAIANNIPIGSEFLMDYSSFMVSLGGRTGYRWDTQYGKINVSGRLGFAFSWVDYDEDSNRPYDWSIRANDNSWLPNNTLTLAASFDSRDIYLNPSEGLMVSEAYTMVGGFLNLGFGNRHYTKSQTKVEAYLTLMNVELTDDYTFKMILASRSSFTTILPTFGYADAVTMVSDLPVIDGMSVGRGWWNRKADEIMLESSLELRMPIVDPLLWSALFFDAASVYGDFGAMAGMGLDDYQFSFGLGLHLNLSIFPIRVYLAKRFYVDEAGAVQWPVDPILPGFFNGFQFVFTVAGMF